MRRPEPAPRGPPRTVWRTTGRPRTAARRTVGPTRGPRVAAGRRTSGQGPPARASCRVLSRLVIEAGEELPATRHPQLRVYPLEVVVHRPHRQEQAGGDVPARHAGGGHGRHLPFPGREGDGDV